MTIVEQLALIAQCEAGEWQLGLMYLCIGALCAIGVCAFAWFVWRGLCRYVDGCRRAGRIGQFLFVVGLIAAVLYGGTKPPQPTHLWRFEYVNGVHDNGSYCTNNLICAAWTFDLPAMEYTIKANYQDLTITNATGECVDPLHPLPDALVREGAHVWPLAEGANAENMRVVIYAAYVPPPVVTTNGVYHLSGVMPAMGDNPGKYVTPGVQIIVNLETGESEIITPTNAPPQPLTNALQTQQENNQ